MTFGLVYASFSLPEWQALKITLFAPCFEFSAPISTFFKVAFWQPKSIIIKWLPEKGHFAQHYMNVRKNQNGSPTIAIKFGGACDISRA